MRFGYAHWLYRHAGAQQRCTDLLATAGRDKFGFSVTGRDAEGRPGNIMRGGAMVLAGSAALMRYCLGAAGALPRARWHA